MLQSLLRDQFSANGDAFQKQLGLEFVTDRDSRAPDGALAKAVSARAADLGLLVLTCGMSGQVIRWIPPLNVSAAEITEGVEIFGEAIGSV